MDIYKLNRNFWNWAFENPEKITPNHAAIYFFAIEHCNRLGWKKKFGFPTMMVCDAIGIKKAQTYIKYFNDLVEWGFFELVEKSTNQYSANIISLVNALPKNGKALDKAIIKHRVKQTKSNSPINKPIYKETNIPIYNNDIKILDPYSFDAFWDLYDYKKERNKCEKIYSKIKDKKKIFEVLPNYIKSTPDKQFRKHPATWLRNECWNDEITINEKNENTTKQHELNNLAKSVLRHG